MLTCHNLSKSFTNSHSNTRVLNQLNLSLLPGSFNVLIGGNGAGKSTLLQLLAGSLSPDSGSILLNDLELTQLSAHKRFQHLSLIHQDPVRGTIGSLSVLENIALKDLTRITSPLQPVLNFSGRKQFRQRACYAELLRSLDMGLESHLDTPVHCLSGGQRQALTLAMSLLSPVKLLLLDEHTAALDPKSSHQLMQLTEHFIKKHKITALMVTHDLSHALQYGDRLLMMHRGQFALDLLGAEKKALQPKDLLDIYYSQQAILA